MTSGRAVQVRRHPPGDCIGLAMRTLWSLWARLRLGIGHLLNAVGVPGVVIPGEYRAEITEAIIHVRIGPLFTIVSVNGVDVYFHRLTGRIDGVGLSPGADCTPGSAPGSTPPDAPPAPPRPPPARRPKPSA